MAFPAAVAFAVHDRRAVARAAAIALGGAAAALALAATAGPVLLAAAVLAVAATATLGLRGRTRLGLGEAAVPALGGAAAGIVLGAILAPEAITSWEALLDRSMRSAGAAALERYRALGVEPGTLGVLEGTTAALAEWLVRLWPALVALPLWLGVWLGFRLVGRWGRLAPPIARRLGRRPFEAFRVGEPAIWLLVAGLAGLWAPAEELRRAAANALLVGGCLYALQGLAVTTWWLNRMRVRTAVRLLGAAALLLFLPPVFLAGALAVGVADHWLDARDRPSRAASAE